MNKETLSQYGWTVICIIVVALMLGLATPFGKYISDSTLRVIKEISIDFQSSANTSESEEKQEESEKPVEQKYTITFDANGGSCEISSVIVTKNDTTILPMPSRANYSFTGWTCDGKEYEYQTITDVSKDITFVAQWTPEITKGLSYELSSDGTYYIVGELNPTKSTATAVTDTSIDTIIVPESYNDLPVKVIGKYAFRDCTRATTVILPKTITTISYGAFAGCESITSFEAPNVTFLGAWSLSYCYNLKNITLSDKITTYSEGTFYHDTALTDFKVSSSTTTIGSYVFENCPLKSLTFPATMTNLWVNVFAGTNLKEITYEGTKSQWSKISKNSSWKGNCATLKTIHCTDGDVTV